MYGQDLMNSLSKVGSLTMNVQGPSAAGSLSTDRTGMIREVSAIPAQKMPSHYRSQSINPREQASMVKMKGKLSRNALYPDPSMQSIQVVSDHSPRGVVTDDRKYRSIEVGKARFKTPAPERSGQMSLMQDPLRYLKKKTGDQKESV